MTSPPSRLGRHVDTTAAGETVQAFIPPPLPPNPPIDVAKLLASLSRADHALGRLDGISALLPQPKLFTYMYVRKEAVPSSQIEGTQSSLDDLLQYEAEALDGKASDDVREVSNYVDAATYGLDRLKELPLSLRLIREMHERLMSGARGGNKAPGEFRKTQNWVGGTRPGNAIYIPPPPNEVMTCLDALEKFFHAPSDLPPLIRAGLIHVQFESIHPFLDGNGRIGRLLITLFLCANGALRDPLLYLSLFFKQHRSAYYDLLQSVRTKGAWEEWLQFFLEGISKTATEAFDSANKIRNLIEQDRDRIAEQAQSSLSVLRLHEILQRNPYLTSGKARDASGLSMPTVNTALYELERLGIVKETTGRERGRVYAYASYLALLSPPSEQ